MLAIFIVALAQWCLLTSARTIPEFIGASNVLKSSARESFETERHFMAKLKEYQALVSDKTLNNHLMSHPMIVRLDENCGDACRQKLHTTFGEQRVTHLDASSIMVTASVAELEAFTSANSESVKFHFAMIPEMKIDSGVSALAKHAKCELSNTRINTNHATFKKTPLIKKTKATVSLLLLLAPLTPTERAEFVAFAQTQAKKPSMEFSVHYPERQVDGEKQYMEVTLGACAQTAAVSSLFANRREVIWVERIMPAYTHNRWARGVCDTGNQASYPLETNPLANFTGSGDIIGLSDTGIDMKNCFFRDPNHATPYIQSTAATATTPNFNHRKVVQYYLLTKGSEKSDGLDDSTGHGTHTAGIAAGRAIQRYGDYKTYEGMTSEAKIAFFDIGDKDSSLPNESLIIPTNIDTGMFRIMYAAGVRVFSNSWGTTANNYDSLAQQVDNFMWNFPDALVLFSAGNTGESGANTVNSPSTNKNGVSVGASLNDHDSWLAYETETEDYYGIQAVAGFSSQGPTQDRRLKPTILAPGFWTTSSYGTYNSTEPFCSSRVLRGTSMACPTAAGYALKVRRYFTDGFYPTGVRNSANGFTPSGALIKAVLVHSGQKMLYRVASDASASTGVHAVTSSSTYPSNQVGYGRIQMNTVLNFAQSSTSPVNFFVIGGATSSDANYAELATTGASSSYTFTTGTGTQHAIRVTMSYTDYPGSQVTTGTAMINVLTLRVTTGSTTLTPYQVSGTIVDNTQVIDIANPTPSTTYTVTVTATTLPQSPQPFALVVSGATTYIPDGPSQDLSYSIPEDNFTASGGALKYILALGFLTLLLAALVYFIRRISNKKTSMLLDPNNFEATDNYYEDGVQDDRMGGKKSIFAKIRDIRSGKRNRQPARDVEMEAYYDD